MMHTWLQKIVIIFLCGLCFESAAQYHKFIEPGKIWREKVEFFSGAWFLDEYQLTVDTTINGNTYKKLEMISSTDPGVQLPYYSAAIREDTIAKKVYIVFPSYTSELLLYDFNLQIGDTHIIHHCFYLSPIPTNPGTFTVDSMGTYIDQYGLTRKVWYLNYSHVGVVARVVEGVGSNTGIFTYSCHFNAWSDLICVHDDSLVFYVNDSPFNNYCVPFIPAGTSEKKITSFKPVAYPNPTTGKLSITIEGLEPGVMVMALDLMGHSHIIPFSHSLDQIHVDLSDFEQGIYFLIVTSPGDVDTYKITVAKI